MEESSMDSKIYRIVDKIMAEFFEKNKGVSLNQIAMKADVSRNTVIRLFSKEGFPRLDTLERIAKSLGYDFYELLCDEYNKERSVLSKEQYKYTQKVMELPDKEIEAVKIMIDGLWRSHQNGDRNSQNR